MLVAAGHRQLAHALRQLKGLAAFLLSNHITQQAAQQPDVGDQGLVLFQFLGVGCLRLVAGMDDARVEDVTQFTAK